jgi:hypothetical protein
VGSDWVVGVVLSASQAHNQRGTRLE